MPLDYSLLENREYEGVVEKARGIPEAIAAMSFDIDRKVRQLMRDLPTLNMRERYDAVLEIDAMLRSLQSKTVPIAKQMGIKVDTNSIKRRFIPKFLLKKNIIDWSVYFDYVFAMNETLWAAAARSIVFTGILSQHSDFEEMTEQARAMSPIAGETITYFTVEGVPLMEEERFVK